MTDFVKTLCAALLLAFCFASPAAAQMCSDGEVLIVSSKPDGTSGRDLAVNAAFNGPDGQSYYDQFATSNAFTQGGVFHGFRPVSVAVPFGEFTRVITGNSNLFRYGAQLLRCPSAKKLSAESWRRYCEYDRLVPTIHVLSGKAVRPFDMARLPIDPLHCSAPSRLGDPDFAVRAGYTHWAPTESEVSGYQSAYYIDPNWQTGAGVLAELYYSGTTRHEGNSSARVWPYSQNDIMIILALTSGDEPITGFGGVTLRAANGGKDLETFYSTTTDDYKLYQYSGEKRCGVKRLGYMSNDKAPSCGHECFLTRADLDAYRNQVSCINGNARWILVSLAGALFQKHPLPPADRGASQVRKEMDVIQRKEEAARKRNDELTLTEKVERAGSLAIHVKWKGSDHVTIPIDDHFRTALWNPEK